jgi:dTDP-glucose 4,6-dehydratase
VRVLVTGGAGFIGSNFARKACVGAYPGITQVTVLDKLTYAGNIENLNEISQFANFKFVEGDICNQALISTVIQECDAVINFAAESHVDRSISDPSIFLTTNVGGVLNILDSIRQSSKNIRFLQVSTDEVYGSIESGAWTEESPLLPNSPYSASKACADLLIRAYVQTYRIDALITRCSNNYGPYQYPEKLIPFFILNLLQGKKVPIYGKGTNIRDWLHVDDHCYGIYLALMNGKQGEVYNIGGGTELSNLALTKILLDLTGKDNSKIEYVSDRPGHDFRYKIDFTKIRNELGYEPKMNFSKNIKLTFEWYVSNYFS